MKRTDCDVVIIGAGVAGLAAVGTLSRAGKQVLCLEAADRIGGRILTVHDPHAPVPIELGAEFIHGRPPQIWDLIRTGAVSAYEHTGEAVHFDRGRMLQESEVGEFAGRLLSQKSTKRKDESFEALLNRSHQPPEIKNWARVYIEGFNAARQERISVASLKQDAEAAEGIEGDRVFRLVKGYDSLVLYLLQSIPEHQSVVQLNSMVERVEWRRGRVAVRYKPALDNQDSAVSCRKVIVTVPLGVLQPTFPGPGGIRFDPEPATILNSARSLEFGDVFRLTFRFRDAFWEEDDRLRNIGFLISTEKVFSTWWTTHPMMSPLLTAWCAGSAADPLIGSTRPFIIAKALDALARILDRKIPRPEAVYFHDWQADPLFRGAYSYVPVNGLAARRALSVPVDDTLFFAGEATNDSGHASTVHGAIESGMRAARQALA